MRDPWTWDRVGLVKLSRNVGNYQSTCITSRKSAVLLLFILSFLARLCLPPLLLADKHVVLLACQCWLKFFIWEGWSWVCMFDGKKWRYQNAFIHITVTEHGSYVYVHTDVTACSVTHSVQSSCWFNFIYFSKFQITSHQPISVADVGWRVNDVKRLILLRVQFFF